MYTMTTASDALARNRAYIEAARERDALRATERAERAAHDAERHAFERSVHECRPTPADIETERRFVAAWDRGTIEAALRGWSTE
jgi:hypothetical protein